MADAAELHSLPPIALADAPVLSVVLPTFNEAGHVIEELDRIDESLVAAAVPHEILVVDDCSTDRTAEKDEALGRARLRRPDHNRGTGTARKHGTRPARGPYG